MPTVLTRVAQVAKAGSPLIKSPPLGWVGLKLGIPADLVQLVAGVTDQAAAPSATIGAAIQLAALNDPVAATVAAGTAVFIEKFDDNTLIELPIATSVGGSVAAPITVTNPGTLTNTLVGASFSISRSSAGIYYVNQGLTASPHCVIDSIGTRYPVGQAFATVWVRILAANRLP